MHTYSNGHGHHLNGSNVSPIKDTPKKPKIKGKGNVKAKAITNTSATSPIYSSIDPSKILEWDEIKNENEAFARKNRNRINLLTKMLEQPVLDLTSMRRHVGEEYQNV